MATYRILVVEDNHEVRRMVTASLKTLGAEIDVFDVPSAEEALVISATLPLDLVVLDFRLPGMTGLDMVTRLRRRRPEAKIILVTGVDDAAIRQQIADAGVAAYFYKPLEIDRFLEAVRRCLWAEEPPPQHQPQPEPQHTPAATIPTETLPPSALPPVTEAAQPLTSTLMPTIDERLTNLRQQLRAVSVMLVDEAGQVVEVAGNPSQITSGSALLASMLQAFRAGVQVSQAMGRGTGSSLQYFAAQRQCLFVAPVGMSHALFVITSGYIEPDKLGTIDRYFQLAVSDLQAILESQAAAERARQDKLEQLQSQLPSQVSVDRATRQRVDEIFSTPSAPDGEPVADAFWDGLSEDEASGETAGKDILSYDQARDLGLAPGEDKPA